MSDKDFSKIETLENWVTWNFLRGELKWSTQETAYEMDLNEQRLVEWVNARRIAMENIAKTQQPKVERIKAGLTEKYIKKDEKPRVVEFDMKKAVKYLDEGLKLQEVAAKFGIKYSDFIIAWNKKIRLANEEWRRQNR